MKFVNILAILIGAEYDEVKNTPKYLHPLKFASRTQERTAVATAKRSIRLIWLGLMLLTPQRT